MKAVPISRYLVFFFLVVCGCVVDLATKSWMFSWLGMPGPNARVFWIWPDYVGFQTSLNEGALFGIGQGQVLLFGALSGVAALAILYWLFFAGAAVDWLLTCALGCVTAGIFGNLYDRLGCHDLTWQFPPRVGEPVYAVRDWILFQANPAWRWPNFNIADSLLVCGAGVLLWHAYAYRDLSDSQLPPRAESS